MSGHRGNDSFFFFLIVFKPNLFRIKFSVGSAPCIVVILRAVIVVVVVLRLNLRNEPTSPTHRFVVIN